MGDIMVKNLSIDPTYNCNKRCLTCRCPDIAKFYPFSQFLDEAKMKELLLAFKHLGGNNVFIFGGEPLLTPITYYILKKAKELQLNTSISTNAICLSDNDIAKKLLSCRPDAIIISLIGTDEKAHEISKVLCGIQNIHKYKQTLLDLSAHITVFSGNVYEITDIFNLAIRYGIRKISFQYVSRTDVIDNESMMKMFPDCLDMKRSHWDLPGNILLKQEQLDILQHEIANIETIAMREEVEAILDPVFTTNYDENTLLTGRFALRGKCSLNDIIVAPNGDLALCPMLQHWVLSNINDIELADYLGIINPYKERLSKGDFFPICYGCCKHTMFYND